jgi:hypothetical protein
MRALALGTALVWVSLTALPDARAEGPLIDHAGVGCVVAGSFPRLEAKLAPEDRVVRARVYFRAENAPNWYYVQMKAEAGSYWAALPKPQPSLKRFDYYIEATDSALRTTRTAEFSPQVVPGRGECDAKLPATASVSSATVTVVAPAGAPAVPAGFSPAGIAGVSASTTGAAVATGTGMSTGMVVGLVAGGAAAAGGAVALASKGGEEGSGSGTSPSSGQQATAPTTPATPTPTRAPRNVGMVLGATPISAGPCTVNPEPVYAGDNVTMNNGIGTWESAAEAQAAIPTLTATFTLDGAVLGPVRYNVITTGCWYGDGRTAPACIAAQADWKATAGAHVATAQWSAAWDRRLKTCEFTVLP